MQLQQLELINGVYKYRGENVDEKFEQLYINARNKEGRLYTNEELAMLPLINKKNPLHREWVMRKESAARLLKWLQSKNISLQILEIGCGNGWLGNLLAQVNGSEVYGMDINFTELKQAASVFKKDNLAFIYGNFTNDFLSEKKFDTIILAASIQYFPSLKNIISNCLKRLNANGEIHILDTNFYPSSAISAAKKRTEEYYALIGAQELAAFYHHHSADELKAFNFVKLYDPSSWKNKLSQNKNPFPWVCIKSK